MAHWIRFEYNNKIHFGTMEDNNIEIYNFEQSEIFELKYE